MKNTISKRASAAVFITALLVGATSCSDFFDEQPYNKYKSADYFANTVQLDMAVLGVYAPLQNKYTYGQSWLAFDNDTDITHIKGADLNTSNPYRDIAHYNVMVGAEMIEGMWKTLYDGIGRANNVLDNYERVPAVTDAEKALVRKLVAETKFLRGMMYFDLVKLYGDVPLILKSAQHTDDFNVPRTPKEQVYDQIILDIEEAIPDLPWHDDKVYAYNYRVTKSGAMGLLARVWLYRGGYSLHQDGQIKRPANYLEYYGKVLDVTDEIIRSGKHVLNASYETVFRNVCNDRKDPKEILLEIDFVNQPGYGDIQGFIGSWNALTTAAIPGVFSRANAFVLTHYKYYSMFEDADLRRDVTIGTYKVVNKNESAVQSQIKVEFSNEWGLGKWRREWQENKMMQLADLNKTDLNYIVVRYSDILLMRAEALNEVNNGANDEARELVNKVRRRGYGMPVDTPDPAVDMPAAIASHDQFLAYLQDERARELGTESATRRMDLIRWNILGDKLKEVYDFCKANEPRAYDDKGKPIEFPDYKRYVTLRFIAYELFQSGRNELYPIPLRELNQNTRLEQNPMYEK